MPRDSRPPAPRSSTSWGISLNDVASIIRALFKLASMLRRTPDNPRPATADVNVDDDGGIGVLFREQRGDVLVTAVGRIVKVLPDDTFTADGTGEHQRLLVELPGRDCLTVKLSHNIEFGRVPARVGQPITFRGDYVYNELGGAVHWTHADPMRRHADGWIEVDGRRYG